MSRASSIANSPRRTRSGLLLCRAREAGEGSEGPAGAESPRLGQGLRVAVQRSPVVGRGHGTGGTEQRGVEMVGRPLPAFMEVATLPDQRDDVENDIRGVQQELMEQHDVIDLSDDEENRQELQLEVNNQPAAMGMRDEFILEGDPAAMGMRDEFILEGDPAPLLQDLPEIPQSRIRLSTTIDLTRSPDTSAPPHIQNMTSPGCSPVPPSSSSISSVQCPVCLESVKSLKSKGYHLMSTTCGHIFCSHCLPECVRLHSQCPTCRQRLTSRDYHKLFLH